MASLTLPTSGPSAETRVTHLASGWEAPMLFLITLLLLSFGLVTVYSSSAVKAASEGLADYYYVVQQAVGGVLGLVLLAAAARTDYRALRLLAWPILLGVMAALLVLILPGTEAIAPVRNGARRWLVIGPLSVQPSEFAKLALVIWTAALVVRKQDQLSNMRRGLIPFLLLWSAVALLIAIQPNLSTAMLVVLFAGIVLFAGGGRIGHFVLLAALAVPVVWTQIEGVAFRLKRIVAFLDPTTDLQGGSYQINQALIALGSGGILGRGFGKGQQKFGFVPEPHNDFLYAMIGEEWGLVGTTIVLLLFTGFALIGFRVARSAPDLFGRLLAIGLTSLISVQALLHIGVNLGLLPTTGVTLPFMSWGRSSLIMCMLAVGILMSIARAAERRSA